MAVQNTETGHPSPVGGRFALGGCCQRGNAVCGESAGKLSLPLPPILTAHFRDLIDLFLDHGNTIEPSDSQQRRKGMDSWHSCYM